MDRPLRRRLQPQARKLEILEAAERLIQAQGARVRVEDVVNAAGVAKGTFFLYFPTWDDLLEAIRERLIAEFDAAHPMPTELDGPIDWPRLVGEQASAFVDFVVARQGLGEAIFHSDFALRRPVVDNAAVRLAAVIRAGQEAGAFAAIDPDPTARLLFAVIHETADAIAEGEDRNAAMAAMQALLRRALAP
ncbi:MAG TPA: helix-turn-helix domain-containing protein [Caulobacteraceae bacterium]|nr:helix-turn-helix domain-containing protein [Caulobacteraceae bacterium]